MTNAPSSNALLVSQALSRALPRRPIAVRPPPASASLVSLGPIVLLLGMLAGILAWLGPDLVRDWSIRDGAVAADRARLEEVRCRTWLRVLRFCHIAVVEELGDAEARRTLRYAFIAMAQEQPVTLRRSRSDPALLTTEIGLQMFFSRLITLTLFCAIVVLCIGVTAMALVRAATAQRAFAAMSGQRLMPVVVEIERKNFVPPHRRLWAYLYDGESGSERATIEWPARVRPLFTSAQERWAVALQGERSDAPLLLDAGLTCLDLTEPERAAFYAACRAAFGEPQSANSA
jgi:hypothetical protein